MELECLFSDPIDEYNIIQEATGAIGDCQELSIQSPTYLGNVGRSSISYEEMFPTAWKDSTSWEDVP